MSPSVVARADDRMTELDPSTTRPAVASTSMSFSPTSSTFASAIRVSSERRVKSHVNRPTMRPVAETVANTVNTRALVEVMLSD